MAKHDPCGETRSVSLLIAMALNLGILLKDVDGTRRAFILHSGDGVHGNRVRS